MTKSAAVVAIVTIVVVASTLFLIPSDSIDASDSQGYIEIVVTNEGTTTSYSEKFSTLSAAISKVEENLSTGVPESIEFHLYGDVQTGTSEGTSGDYHTFSFPSKWVHNSTVFIPNVSIVGHDDATLVSDYDYVQMSFTTTGAYQESATSQVKTINEGSVTISNISFTPNLRILVEHINNQNVGSNNVESSSNVTTITGCHFQAILYTLTNGEIGSNSAIVKNCTFTGEGSSPTGYAYFAQGRFSSVQFENNDVNSYPRGINIDLNSSMESNVRLSDNTISNIYGIEGTGRNSAIQFTCADSISVVNNTIMDVAYNVFAVYPRGTASELSDYLGPVSVSNNTIKDAKYLIINTVEGFDSIDIRNNQIDEGVDLVNGYNRDLIVQESQTYVSSDDNVIVVDNPSTSWDDDDDLPPFIPTQPAEDDDTVTIVACAAAAAVAAILAVFLVIDRKG